MCDIGCSVDPNRLLGSRAPFAITPIFPCSRVKRVTIRLVSRNTMLRSTIASVRKIWLIQVSGFGFREGMPAGLLVSNEGNEFT